VRGGIVAIQILRRRGGPQQLRADRYMREIRDIVKGGFSRRELLKMGLVMGSEGLFAMRGMRAFRPYWAHADDGGAVRHVSPPNTPFVDPLPIPRVVRPATLDPAPTRGSNPLRSSATGFTETNRPDHQRWTEFGGYATAAGCAATQHELVEMAVQNDFYPDVDGQPSSTVWTYVDAATLGRNAQNSTVSNPAPVWIHARYGTPTLVRVHNALPDENNGFGINQTSTHLHNGHNPSESDGGPLQFYDAGQFKDFHYPNCRAGFSATHPSTQLMAERSPATCARR